MKIEINLDESNKSWIFKKVKDGYVISDKIPDKLIGATAIGESLVKHIEEELSDYNLTPDQRDDILHKLLKLIDSKLKEK